MMTILQTNHLSVGYKAGIQARKIIRDLNVSVIEGELIGIIGQNGIGKSTLLRTIAKLQEPLEGEVLIDGLPITKYSRNIFAQKISFVSTEIVKLHHCTVRQLVSFGRSPYTNWFGQLSAKDGYRNISEAEKYSASIFLSSIIEIYDKLLYFISPPLSLPPIQKNNTLSLFLNFSIVNSI